MTQTTLPTLLLLDDEERILRSLRMLFRNEYQILTATSGQEALALLEKHNVQVLLSDQRMPNMTGVEVLRKARDISPTTMRILLTGYSDFEAVMNSVNEGEVFRFLRKPWSIDTLKSAVAEAATAAQETAQLLRSTPQTTEPIISSDGKVNILILDEDKETLHAINDMALQHINIFCARTLREAFEIIAKHDIAILISELVINQQDISGTIKALRKHKPSLLAIVVTSFSDVTSLIDLINQGQVYRYLPKPVSSGLLQRAISTSLIRFEQLRARPELNKRYAVDAPQDDEQRSFSDKVKNYLDKIRSRSNHMRAN
ncbi:MAG: response regulator [Gammaproteobacteria bacterium]|nr:response regulator [Gammaproteobacteria bacterium]